MFCKYCGETIDSDSVFCRHCGKKQELTASKFESVISKVVLDKPKEDKPKNISLDNEYDLLFSIKVSKYRWYGFIIIIVVLLGSILTYYEVADIYGFYTGSFILVIARLILSYKISSSVKELNRNSFLWWWFTFLLTGPALIVYGSLKKNLLPINFKNYSDTGKAEFLNNYSYRIAKQFGQYDKAGSIIEKSLEFDRDYDAAYDTRAYIKYYKGDYESALEDINHAIDLCSTEGIYFFHRGHILRELNDMTNACLNFNKANELCYSPAKRAIKLYCD